MATMALSLVMTSWRGTSSTCSIMLIFWPDVVEERDQPVRAGRHGVVEFAEAFARVLETLGHDDQRLDRNDDDADDDENDRRSYRIQTCVLPLMTIAALERGESYAQGRRFRT